MQLWRWQSDAKRWELATAGTDMEAGTFLNGSARLIPLPRQGWALLARRGIRINGRDCFPIEVLSDRDEIFAAGEFWCFATDTPALEATFVARKTPMRCARCLGGLKEGDLVCICPCCRAQYHRADCWSYDPACARCGYTTSGEAWIPERLE